MISIYLFVYVFVYIFVVFSIFVFKSCLLHLFRSFQFSQWSVRLFMIQSSILFESSIVEKNMKKIVVSKRNLQRKKNNVTSVFRKHCRKTEKNTWLKFWHLQTLHQTFRFSSVHFFFLVLEFSFNEYRLSRTTVTFEKNEKIMLRACLKSRLKFYLISESFYEN